MVSASVHIKVSPWVLVSPRASGKRALQMGQGEDRGRVAGHGASRKHVTGTAQTSKEKAGGQGEPWCGHVRRGAWARSSHAARRPRRRQTRLALGAAAGASASAAEDRQGPGTRYARGRDNPSQRQPESPPLSL